MWVEFDNNVKISYINLLNKAFEYNLKYDISNRMIFTYKPFIGNKGNTKVVTIGPGNILLSNNIRIDAIRKSLLANWRLKIWHWKLQVGDVVTRDCSCDSAFMLKVMDEVGQSIRSAFHWIPASERCWLVMDNAGGHGTKEAIGEYVHQLNDKYIHWQDFYSRMTIQAYSSRRLFS